MEARTVIDDMDVFYRTYKTNDDDDFCEIIENLEDKISDQLIQGCKPHNLMAVGQTLFIGYDSEWVNKNGYLHVVSYQFYLIGIGGEIAVVFIADERLALTDMLNVVLKIALQTGTVLHYPRNIVLTGFFLRADLGMLSDFIEFKNDLSNIAGSVATVNRPLHIDFECHQSSFFKADSNRTHAFHQGMQSYSSKITFYDLTNHAPKKAPLAALGNELGIEKLTVSNIAQMDKVRDQEFELFIDYGIRDAEIVVKYYQHIIKFSEMLLEQKDDFIAVTAGALAVSLCKKTIVESGLDFEETFGLTHVKRKVFDGDRIRLVTKKEIEHTHARKFYEDFVSQCYHGGLNVCYYAGPTEEDVFLDFDLSGAYTTGLTVIRPFDYEAGYESRKLKDFLGDLMVFSLVRFKFTANTKYPCLPVDSACRDGLNFPLEGESFCTAPELALAKKLGAEITIERGVIYPWKSEERIFKPFVQKIRKLRKQSEKGSFSNQYAKLLGNSLYGKTGQGVKEKRVFDTQGLQTVKVPESRVTNAAMAAYVTGFIRAVMGEIVCGIPKHRLIVNCVTDGILTNAREDEIDLSGELCQRFQSLIDDGGKMFEIKHEVKQALSIRTRGVATLIPGDNPLIKSEILAKAGVAPPSDCEDKNKYIVDLYYNRAPGQKVMTHPFVSIRDQYIKARDVVRLDREITLNYEYDFKRRPVNPRMVGSHVAFDTAPWDTIETAGKVHELFSSWNERHCIKTLEDFDVWEDYYQSHLALDKARDRFPNGRLPIQITVEGSIGVLKRLFLRAYNNSSWGVSRTFTYKELAKLMNHIGFNVTAHDAKNGNKGVVYDNLVPSTKLTKPLVKKLQKAFPELDTTKIFIP
jgi:hypothetical protein